jgi:hypothetical protein
MSQINPITGSIVQASTLQRELAARRAGELRQAHAKNSAVNTEDEVDESVANADQLQAIGDSNQKRGKGKPGDEPHQPADADGQDDDGQPRHLDLTA